MRPKKNQKVKLSIQGISSRGEGIGSLAGYTLFVDQTLPQEIVQAEITQVKKSYGHAKLLHIEKQSKQRIDPPCPYYTTCGGCQLMHLDYQGQLEVKRQRVKDAFERIGKFSNIEVMPSVPSPLEFSYRNKMQVAFEQENDSINCGFFKRGTHDVIDIEHCLVHNPLGENVYSVVRETLLKTGIPAYDSKTEKGELRHVIIKTGIETGQALVVIVTKSDVSSRLKNHAEKIMQKCLSVKGVVLNINNKAHNVVLGKNNILLAGQGFIEERLCGLTFKISPSSFFQVNPYQAKNVYERALELADLKGNETVLDAFCGTGTMSLMFAQKAKHVIGIEVVPDAIEDAKQNAMRNNIKNVAFECALAEKWIKKSPSIDVALLNPPRKGCDPSFIEALLKLKPKTIVYVSCDPATIARDCRIFCDSKYVLKEVTPFDMFPQTAHVETVARLVPC